MITSRGVTPGIENRPQRRPCLVRNCAREPGAITAKCQLFGDAGTASPFNKVRRGVWVSASARRTRWRSRSLTSRFRNNGIMPVSCPTCQVAVSNPGSGGYFAWGCFRYFFSAPCPAREVARTSISRRPCESTRASTCLPESSQRLSLATQRNAALLLSSAREMASSSGKQVLDRESLFGPEKMCRCPSAKAGTHNHRERLGARWSSKLIIANRRCCAAP